MVPSILATLVAPFYAVDRQRLFGPIWSWQPGHPSYDIYKPTTHGGLQTMNETAHRYIEDLRMRITQQEVKYLLDTDTCPFCEKGRPVYC